MHLIEPDNHVYLYLTSVDYVITMAITVSLEMLPSDPGLRQKISSYHPNNHDEIRRHYLTKSPCQPVLCDFPVSHFS